MTKRSDIYLAAWMAAEKALPAESKQLIESHDKLFEEWRKADFASPIPAALKTASDAVDADPLASIAFKLRQQTNESVHKEWKAKEGK